jgi:hypothetical protein
MSSEKKSNNSKGIGMKRIFVINGICREAPDMTETPARGSLVAYVSDLYEVVDVVYYVEINTVHILLYKKNGK